MAYAPLNVRAQMIDGSVVPIELVYRGVDERGIHRWEQVSPESLAKSQLVTITADKLPGRTAISICIDTEA